MKNTTITIIFMSCLAGIYPTCYAKDLTPAEQEVKTLTAQLKEKRAALKAEKKKDQLVKAEAAAAKAAARVEKLKAASN